MNIIIIHTDSNHYYIGEKVKIDKNGLITVKNVFTIVNSIRNDNSVNLCEFKFIENNEVVFSNYIYYASPNKDYAKLYEKTICNYESCAKNGN